MSCNRGSLPRIGSVAIATGVALAVLLGFATHAAAAKRPRLGVMIPDPGHVSFAVASAEINAGKPGQLPEEVRLGFPKARKLPESVRLVWGTRAIHKRRKVTYAAAILIVNQAPGNGAARRLAATPGSKGGQPGFEDLIWDMFVTDAGVCSGCNQHFAGEDLNSFYDCSSCAKHRQTMYANPRVDEGSTKKMRNVITDLFKGIQGDNPTVFDEAREGEGIETGHYDDGHAFGWEVESKREERDLLDEAIDGIRRREGQAAYLASLEAIVGADLNGDGVVTGIGDGSGTFTRSQQCEFVTDPPNCTYLDVAVTFTSSFQAFEIEVPGYRVQPGELTGVNNQGGAEIGACGPTEPTVVRCNLDFPMGAAAVVSTQVETATDASPEGVRLPDGHGGLLFEAEPSPSSARLGGPFTITGP